MKATKQTVKKEAEKLLNNSETTVKNSCVNSITKDSFSCEYHNSLTNDDLIKRAAAVDRACYHDRKINGGLSVQAAIAFIMDHKEVAKQIEIRSTNKNSSYWWLSPSLTWFAYLNGKKICGVNFSASDYKYSLDLLRL